MASRSQVMAFLLLALGATISLFPLWWMTVTSLQSASEAGAAVTGAKGLSLWPHEAQVDNYPEALAQMGSLRWQGFLDALANSTVVASLVVTGTVLSSSLVAFAFARLRFRARGLLFTLMLATMMLPGQVVLIPLFLLFRYLGWVDTLLPLIVPAFFGSAFFIFMYRQFMAQIPEALFEAARMDGYGPIGLWWHVALPLSRPVTATTAVFTFIWCWNDFLGPLIYLQSESQMTLAVALNGFRSQYGGLDDVHLLMAASIVTMIPCLLIFFAAQRHFVEGLSRGGVKG
ncbi:MAG: carbohydrate ABC transporter permease [Phycisphaerales bacterium]|nr:carbohydrate ABC transporter permease [Phycisphaerales bacterium]